MSITIVNYKKQDEYYTPDYAVKPIIKFLKPNSTIWCPFDKEWSEYVKLFTQSGHNVVYTHIDKGEDFFKVKVPYCDYIISNPPYSLKNEVIYRLYEIGKPFAMLINFNGLFDSKKRFELFRSKGVELMVLSPRVRFIMQKGTNSKNPPFQSCYLCRDILPQDIVFETMNKYPEQTSLFE